MLFFSVLNILMFNQTSVGVVEIFFGLLNLYFFYCAYHNTTQYWHTNLLMLSLTAVIFHTFSFADLRAGSVFWLLFLPPLFCLLSGAKYGFIYTLLLAIPAAIVLYVKSDTESYIAYRAVLNFVLTYFLSYFICYLYQSQYMARDIRLQKMAFQDPLTGAKNRHALKLFFNDFNKHQEPCLPEEERTHLLIIDIDYFKLVNDEFGHDVGDAVLVQMTELLHLYADSDTVYRIGGEEFLIVLREHTSSQTLNFAEALRKNVEETVFHSKKQDIKVTVSIGIAPLHQGQTFREFLKAADKNLYSAKHKGRNMVHCDALNNDTFADHKA
ncbi:GGDEF domain-containing protein [Marinomonas sp. A79]|uniref:diguanylate cyclase n=2 Tax=Marinomonas vulgaris TaxID=2823372 RepID=A0ABS5HCD0_9GAMM|nr:GGDEF domain-containing protein [Marinomonas vulgaris]